MNALFEHLRARITRDGPLSVAQFMEEALGNVEHGYYITRDPLGARGDFITSPEISQIFGELLGMWCAAVWQSMGEPDSFHWVEIGPGRGTLMADAVRATGNVEGFLASAHIHMVETSPVLMEAQKAALSGVGVNNVTWHRDVSQVPDGPMLCLANEFFDALPIRQFQRVLAGWRERLVDVNADMDGLEFRLSGESAEDHFIPNALHDAPDGAIAEISPASLRIMHTLAERLVRDGGSALIIDYGHTRSAPGETLQAMQNHKYADVLDAPGEQDLTAHVDFDALGQIAKVAGAKVHGPVEQGEFLKRLGLAVRAKRLAGVARDKAQAQEVVSGAARLVDPAQMGRLFKVMGVSAPQPLPLPGLE